MKKTKVVCTIGPASEKKESLERLIGIAGMNVMRMNFSHGDYEEQGFRIKNVKELNKEHGWFTGIALDTKGPEIRTGYLQNDEPVMLHKGDIIRVTMDYSYLGNKDKIANAPVLIVSTFERGKSGFFQDKQTNEVGDGWGAYDNGLSNCYLILKARAMGFDTLIMGMRDADQLRELFSIPGNETVMAVISLGYRAEEPQRPTHRELDEIVKFF